MRTISFRAKDPSEAGKRLEDALNTDQPTLDTDRLQKLADVLGQLFSIMPAGRQVAVSLSVHNGSEPEADGKERVRVKVATLTDRATGSLAEKHGGAAGGDLSLEVSTGDEAHARQVAQEQQAERDRAARAAQQQADDLRNKPAEPGVRPGDVVNP